ncbi:MAG: hypothetical protein JSS66_04285 [Armatimonadetes bacterium]|nr:hypothetical protein [Armatimonadota bacterium]
MRTGFAALTLALLAAGCSQGPQAEIEPEGKAPPGVAKMSAGGGPGVPAKGPSVEKAPAPTIGEDQK